MPQGFVGVDLRQWAFRHIAVAQRVSFWGQEWGLLATYCDLAYAAILGLVRGGCRHTENIAKRRFLGHHRPARQVWPSSLQQ